MATASEIHILAIFSCDTGAVEPLALAAAVGAVQARALIRLRRIVNPGEAVFAETERLGREYVAPRETDAAWADGLVLAASGPLLSHFLKTVYALGSLSGKPIVLLPGDQAESLKSADVLSDVEVLSVDRKGALLAGRRIAETARARRESSLRQP
jgi:hypothetical protein